MIYNNGMVVDHTVKLELTIKRGVYNQLVDAPITVEELAKALLEELGYSSVTEVIVRKV